MNLKRVPSRVCEVPGCPSVQYRQRLPDDPVVGFNGFPEELARRSLRFRKLGVIPSRKLRLFLCLLHFDGCHIQKIGYNGVPFANWRVGDSAVPTLNLAPRTVETSPAPRLGRRCEPLLIGSPR